MYYNFSQFKWQYSSLETIFYETNWYWLYTFIKILWYNESSRWHCSLLVTSFDKLFFDHTADSFASKIIHNLFHLGNVFFLQFLLISWYLNGTRLWWGHWQLYEFNTNSLGFRTATAIFWWLFWILMPVWK